ncbi:pyrroline-5-carboxylate reductase [Candidatus Bathyarchaeota archaeon]|nr:pyrroline-5-carboxylate reductase [Candidatus Bathyarchaeota archaeon]
MRPAPACTMNSGRDSRKLEWTNEMDKRPRRLIKVFKMDIKKLGIIGVGAMGSTMVRVIVNRGIIKPENINAHDINLERLEMVKEELGINIDCSSNAELVASSDTILMAVKPQELKHVLEGMAPALDPSKAIITIVTGVPMSFYWQVTGKQFPISRVMPNTPALVHAGVSCVSFNELVSVTQKRDCITILKAIGTTHEVPEKYLDAVTGLSGSGPAYVYYILEGLTDGGVKMGLPRDLSRSLATDTIIGSLKLMKETGKHPMLLKDQVTSPGGTTIDALHVLENENLKGILIKAVEVASLKSRHLSNQFKDPE